MDAQFASILRKISDAQKEMALLIERRDAQLTSHISEEFTALYEMIEMSFYVTARSQIEGIYDGVDSEDPEDMLKVFNRLSELQNEFLATMSVATFLRTLGGSDK